MIIPEHWAEARVQRRIDGRQVTVRRFGWSQTDLADAEAMAESRATEAIERLVRGEQLDRREPKVAYNGAEGVPIREEVVLRHGDHVITRNSYGALCLNTPEVLFADIDYQTETPCEQMLVGFVVALVGLIAIGIFKGAPLGIYFGFVVLAAIIGPFLASVYRRARLALGGGHRRTALRRLEIWMRAHPDWLVRVYDSPAGLRLLAEHALFDPAGAAAEEFFQAMGTDRLYAQMCRRQGCFRARLTAKHWRIGISKGLRKRSWPWPADLLPEREAWIARYEAEASSYAACRYASSYGEGRPHPEAEALRKLHDEMSRATSDLPIA